MAKKRNLGRFNPDDQFRLETVAAKVRAAVDRGDISVERGKEIIGDFVNIQLGRGGVMGTDAIPQDVIGKPLSREQKSFKSQKKGRKIRKQRSRQVRGVGKPDLTAIEELGERLSRGQNVSGELEARLLEELPENIRGPLESEVLIPQREDAENQRRVRRMIASEMKGARLEGSELNPYDRIAAQRFFKDIDIEAFEQELIDAYVKQGLSPEAARASAETARKSFEEDLRTRRPSDTKDLLVPTALDPKEGGQVSSREYDLKGKPLRSKGKFLREQERSTKVFRKEDSPGAKDDFASSLAGTRELKNRRSSRLMGMAVEAKKAGSFSVKSGDNEYIFSPNKEGNFDITRRFKGRKSAFLKSNIVDLANVTGQPLERFNKVAAAGSRFTGGRGKQMATLTNAISQESLFDAFKANPEMGPLLKNKKFLDAFRDVSIEGSEGALNRRVGGQTRKAASRFGPLSEKAMELGKKAEATKIAALKKSGRIAPLLLLASIIGGASMLGGESEGA